ncbi:HTH-type transcriptional regulator / antitoxin HipB [Devosia crocina]|uniref:HTH-type transcriptional regulator / antitoxin HipB n=1 Tax=Devosia crocina TaxID=429728 RepID=A0A1I7NV84_9HYPH|nr:helix-turn-helix transcriptional regulator [Devosia crocina]SFV38567.1 HTH-type transcriptional regulator / antitoxin HipB [Devosia crocina]
MPSTIRSPRQLLLVQRIIEARKAAGMTQAELAGRLGRHQPFIANIESGQRRVDLVELIELAGLVGLDLHHVIDKLESLPIGTPATDASPDN